MCVHAVLLLTILCVHLTLNCLLNLSDRAISRCAVGPWLSLLAALSLFFSTRVHRLVMTFAILPNSFCRPTHSPCFLESSHSDTRRMISASSLALKDPCFRVVLRIQCHMLRHCQGMRCIAAPTPDQSVRSVGTSAPSTFLLYLTTCCGIISSKLRSCMAMAT